MTKTPLGQADATVASAPTILEIIIDETLSMQRVKAATIAAFNQFIKDQKDDPASCQVTMTKFSTSRVITPYEMIDLAMVPEMNSETYDPNGGTNLYNTILDRIAILSDRIGDAECNVVFLVITDGEDNAHRATHIDVRHALTAKMESGWTFVYLGAHQGAVHTAALMGFPDNNVKAFAATSEAIYTAMTHTSNATKMYRQARSSGAVAVGTTSTSYFSE